MEGRIKILVVTALWLALLVGGVVWLMSSQVQRISIAGGPRGSESFVVAEAIAEVFNSTQANISAEVFETGGSTENVRLLEEGKIDIATMIADTQVYGGVQAVASLYHDTYQLIVSSSSEIHSFHDLAGHRIAIPPRSSGQYEAFWKVASYYGLQESSITALPMSEDAANFAMIMRQVDAVFRVRAPGNAAIKELVRDHPMRLVAIPHAQALALDNPALSSGVIAEGAYRGYPPLPRQATPTAVVERLLVARSELPAQLVYTLTKNLYEHRSSLVTHTSLAGFIKPVSEDGKLSLPAHPGALQYYDREKPNFLQQNARVLSALLYPAVILSSAGYAIRASWRRRRRVRMGDYNRQLMDMAEQAQLLDDLAQLGQMKKQLVEMLRQLVDDLDEERVTQDEFEHFSFTWQAVDAIVRDRLAQLSMSKPL